MTSERYFNFSITSLTNMGNFEWSKVIFNAASVRFYEFNFFAIKMLPFSKLYHVDVFVERLLTFRDSK